MSDTIWDYVIVGGGISGLYLAHQLQKKYKDQRSILILEKEPVLGGRIRQTMYHSHRVVTGAGVGRWNKDVLLAQLVQDAVPQKKIKPWTSRVSFSFPPVDTFSFLSILKKQHYSWLLHHRSTHTFREAFLHFFTLNEYKRFCDSNGYTDFEKADAIDTLDNYGFEDNQPGVPYFNVPWNRLVDHLRSRLKQSDNIHIQTRIEVMRCSFDQSRDLWTCRTNHLETVKSRVVVFAGSVLRFPDPIVRRNIRTQPFLRMYGWTPPQKNKASPKVCPNGMCYRTDAFQKQIRISPHVWMLSYSDNRHAIRTNRMTEDQIRQALDFPIQDIRRFFWKHGTHYYPPLPTKQFKDREAFIRYAQHPRPGLFLVGEAISNNQGWTQGALESVHKILHLL